MSSKLNVEDCDEGPSNKKPRLNETNLTKDMQKQQAEIDSLFDKVMASPTYHHPEMSKKERDRKRRQELLQRKLARQNPQTPTNFEFYTAGDDNNYVCIGQEEKIILEKTNSIRNNCIEQWHSAINEEQKREKEEKEKKNKEREEFLKQQRGIMDEFWNSNEEEISRIEIEQYGHESSKEEREDRSKQLQEKVDKIYEKWH